MDASEANMLEIIDATDTTESLATEFTPETMEAGAIYARLN
jgi:hypothetical protein